jgi:hypothetical protein
VWNEGERNSDRRYYSGLGTNKESKEIVQKFHFSLAVKTTVGEGNPVYTYQNANYNNTISVNGAVIIPDTPENRAFLEEMYAKLDNLIQKLKDFFETSESVLNLIASNQKLLQ